MTTDSVSRDDDIVGVIGPVEPRRLAQVVSVRLDPEVAGQLRDIANQLGCTVSDLLRRGAIAAANEPNVMRIEWITPPTAVTGGGQSATFDASQPWAETWEEEVAFIGGESPDNAGWIFPKGICDDPKDFADQVPNAGVAIRCVYADPWHVVRLPGSEA